MIESEKFKNKYRIKSARKEGYDYGQNGCYFVTIVTRDRENFFGEINNHEMEYSDIGKIALQCWRDIPDHFPFVKLGEFIVMPNHVHGIIEIDKLQNYVRKIIGTGYKNVFGPQSNNLASIIRGFKIGVTKYTRLHTDIHIVLQPRFHDRIIRNEKEYINIKNYIINNPSTWGSDENYFCNKFEIND